MSSTADTTASTMVPIPRRIQPEVVVRTRPRQSRGGRLLSSDFATVDGHRKCHTYTGFRNFSVRKLGFTGRRTCREFLHVLEDSFSHDEVWPQPYDHLYVLLESGRSVGKEPDADELGEPVPDSTLSPRSNRRNWSHYHQARRPSSRRTWDWSQYHRTRSWLTIHTNQTCISTTFPM